MGWMNQGIDVTNVSESGGGGSEPIPAGEYTIAAKLWSDTTANSGANMIEMEFDIVGPSHAGRKVWERFVMPKTPSSSVVGLQRLMTFVRSTGQEIAVDPQTGEKKLTPDNLNVAMGKQVAVSLEIEKGGANGNGGTYPDKNRIASFKSGSAPAPATAQPQAPQQAQATPAPGLNTANVDWSG